MAKKKVEKRRSGFVIYSYFKDIAFTALKRDAMFKTGEVEGVRFVK